MRGKYSPTVSEAYAQDQDWFDKLRPGDIAREYNAYDVEGYDAYGYDKNDKDRAGNFECDYYHNDGDYDLDLDYNNKYDAALEQWGFDGVRPVRRK